MASAMYRLKNEEISDIVDTTAEELMKKFSHKFPKGTEITGSFDRVRLGSNLELPRTITVEYKGSAKFPETKLGGLYKRVR